MQFNNIIIILASMASLAMAAPQPNNKLAARAPIDTVNSVLKDARNSAMEQMETGGGKGRKLSSAACSQSCDQCRSGAVTKAIGEVGVCGTAALAIEVATAGAATILEVAGFISCQVAIMGELNSAEASCASLP